MTSSAQSTDTPGTAAAGAGAAAAANGNGAFTAPEWLPGIDAESAKFVTELGYKDLPSFVKGSIETKRAFSAPRAMEMPKEGDVEGWKKFNAAIGVPETPDKYDFGDIGKAMKPEELKSWSEDLHKLGIPNKQAAALAQIVTQRGAAFKEAEAAAWAEQSASEAESKQLEWGDKAPAHVDLAARGFGKLAELLKKENTVDFREKIEKAFGTKDFLEVGLILGRHMVESGFVMSSGQQRGLTKEAASAARQAFQNNPAKWGALWDPNHADHKAMKSEWSQLGEVINR